MSALSLAWCYRFLFLVTMKLMANEHASLSSFTITSLEIALCFAI
jgi:hypothetical protein